MAGKYVLKETQEVCPEPNNRIVAFGDSRVKGKGGVDGVGVGNSGVDGVGVGNSGGVGFVRFKAIFGSCEIVDEDGFCPPQFLLIADNDTDSDTEPRLEFNFPCLEAPLHTTTTPLDQTNPHFLALSDAAYFGLHSQRAIRITGYIYGQPVTILIDCGSTHNIIQPRIASLLPITPTNIKPFPVMVGSCQFLECKALLPTTPLEVNKTQFHVPLFIIDVAGADVILGLAWLSSLGPILADFSIPQLSFTVKGKQCTVRGEPLAAPVTPSSLNSLIRKNSVASLHTMSFHHQPSPTATINTTNHPNTTINA
nr:hypothetical protein [Tanacetum cinerariifolium]